MNALFAAAAELQAFCTAQGWRCCVIGGLAVQRWGDPRQTRDVDVTLLTGLGGEERFIDPILARYRPRFPEARAFALEHRVLLVETAHGIPLDIALGGLPYEARVVERSTPFAVEPAVTLMTCSAEDLLVLKTFAGRAQDWIDVESVIVRQGSRLERELVVAELKPLVELKEDPGAEHAFGLGITIANYDVTRDGQRFVMVKDESSADRLNIVLNWHEELKRLVPTR